LPGGFAIARLASISDFVDTWPSQQWTNADKPHARSAAATDNRDVAEGRQVVSVEVHDAPCVATTSHSRLLPNLDFRLFGAGR
jgi:hypothetical protein